MDDAKFQSLVQHDGLFDLGDPENADDILYPDRNDGTVSDDGDHWNDPIVTNEKGGSQSYVGVRFDLIPNAALRAVAEVLHKGEEKYGRLNWYKLPVYDHLNHAAAHLNEVIGEYSTSWKFSPETEEFPLSDRRREDLAHAVCRLLFALEQQLDIEDGIRNYSEL